MRVAIGAGLALLLAGCDTGGESAAPQNQSASREPASDAKMADPLTASGGSNDCAKNPDFAPIYDGGKITVCSSTHFGNTGKDSGSFHYTTDAAPAAVLAFSREAAEKAGFKVLISNPTMLSAADGDKRRFVVFPSAEGSG
ncbi:MAG: hypothetical protein ACAH11_09570, partial [Sphingomonas sp.]